MRTRRVLLFVLAISLAVMPLRGVLAFFAPLADAGGMSHCDMVQGGMHAQTDMAATLSGDPDRHCPGCAQDGSPDRCSAHCTIFLHAFSALPGSLLTVRLTTGPAPAIARAGTIPDCPHTPLYRPPILNS